MDTELVTTEDDDLTMSEGLVKVVLAAGAAFLTKRFVENVVEDMFKRYHNR